MTTETGGLFSYYYLRFNPSIFSKKEIGLIRNSICWNILLDVRDAITLKEEAFNVKVRNVTLTKAVCELVLYNQVL